VNFKRIYEACRLLEVIKKLEGKPRKTKMEPRYVKWFKNLDSTQQRLVIRELAKIHEFGKYGEDSHEEQGKRGLYGISISNSTLRVYFTEIDEKYILLEGGSSTKNGAGNGSEQDREIKAIWKIVQERKLI
jgi:hypothetical protein